nr:hypothetical protein [Kiritimatiellia bacterium]
RPEITQLHLHTDYPAYTERESSQTSGPAERITALVGSTLTLSIESNVELENTELIVGEESMGAGSEATLNGQRVSQWQLPIQPPAETRQWRVELQSKEGFSNHATHRDLVVTEDRTPVVTLLHPTRSRIQLSPNGFVPLRYEVDEDFGLSRVELHLEVDGTSSHIKPQALPETAGSTRTGVIPLDLASLKLGNARTVKASIQVFDTLPEELGGPHRGISDTLTIDLSSSAESLNRQTISEDQQLAEQTLETLIADLEQLLKDSNTLQEHTRSDEEKSNAEAATLAGKIRRELGRVDSEVLKLSRTLQDRFFNSLSAVLVKVSRQQLREAQRLSQSYSLTDGQPEKLEIVTDLQAEIQQALDELRQVQDQVDPLTADAERLADLIDIQHQQDQLVEESNQEEWEQQLEDWQQRQNELAEQLAALTEQDEALEKLVEQSQEAAAQLTEAAEKAR